MEAGEGERRLGLDAGGAQHAHSLGTRAGVLQERRLADAGLAGDDEHPVSYRADIDPDALRIAPDDHPRSDLIARNEKTV